MPRKQKQIDTNETKKTKKTLLNTIVKNVNQKDEHIILQLPLTQHHIDKIINSDKTIECTNDPIPYERNCCFIDDIASDNKIVCEAQSMASQMGQAGHLLASMASIPSTDQQTSDFKHLCCFWCCHNIDYKVYGMPVNYDSINDTYILYGSFCSLQCANAYNFSAYNGCDKVWEINSMIQMMAKRYGITNYIRPAPSRYLLKMFNGYLTIEEFRNLHKNNETTHVLNLPPMIAISSGYEVVNTSYISKQVK